MRLAQLPLLALLTACSPPKWGFCPVEVPKDGALLGPGLPELAGTTWMWHGTYGAREGDWTEPVVFEPDGVLHRVDEDPTRMKMQPRRWRMVGPELVTTHEKSLTWKQTQVRGRARFYGEDLIAGEDPEVGGEVGRFCLVR
ncbi:MAG: hypothetical protein H6741_17310 [Alphaproteobacteria bacterium]|nr:hypothetical protein [Alphaproteobacteria bacterium]MCB9794476.1 hypothetical protein [Alphaproteobacteria bacterium]